MKCSFLMLHVNVNIYMYTRTYYASAFTFDAAVVTTQVQVSTYVLHEGPVHDVALYTNSRPPSIIVGHQLLTKITDKVYRNSVVSGARVIGGTAVSPDCLLPARRERLKDLSQQSLYASKEYKLLSRHGRKGEIGSGIVHRSSRTGPMH